MRYKFIYWLRFLGVSLIVYDHLGALRNPDWAVTRGMEYYVNQPLGIIQYFGALGVSLFFIISGFCFAPKNLSGSTFLLKRMIKIMGSVMSATVLFFVFNKIVSLCISPTYWDQFSAREWVEGTTLTCFLFGRENIINGAAWYLFPLIVFEAIIAFFYPIIKKNTLYLIGIVDAIYLLILLWVRMTGNYIVHMQWLVFVLFPLFGVLLRAFFEKRISVKQTLLILLIHWILCVECIVSFRKEYYIQQPYLISLAYAILLFSVFMSHEERFVLPKAVEFIADISFSIYLLHMMFGSMMMSYMESRGLITVGFLSTAVFIVVLATLHYKYIEKSILDELCRKVK